MKRILAIILIVFAFIPLAACGNSNKADISFSEFEEKYKRADFDSFINDPAGFLSDYVAVSTLHYEDSYPEEELSFLEEWKSEGNEERDYETMIIKTSKYTKDGVLFNKSVQFDIQVDEMRFLNDEQTGEGAERIKYTVFAYIEFETGNSDTDIEIAKALTNEAFHLFGDPKDIEIDFSESSESELRKLFESGEKKKFSVSFDDLIISYYYFGGGAFMSENSSLNLY